MAVLVKPDGAFGKAYMAVITPFWHLVIYPQMLGRLEREWRRPPATSAATAA